jgi:predicted neutral ceramidase superfamily lipid hydrolase
MQVHQLVRDPSGVIHRWVLDFELAFFDEQKYSFIQRSMYNWWWLSLLYALFYIIAIFIGRAWMARRNEKFELRQSLILWNTILTIFSLWGAYRCIPEFIYALTQHGFMYSVCDSTYREGITGLW